MRDETPPAGTRRGPLGTALQRLARTGALLVITLGRTDVNAATGDAAGALSEETYGRRLPIIRELGTGPTMAVRVAGDRLVAVGRGKLTVFDIGDPAGPSPLGSLSGLGNTRQIAVERGVAYVTSREDGVFIVDVSASQAPCLLSRFDSVEVATGVDVSHEVLFVACRSHGVQLVDVSDPRRPRHLSLVRTGEAQSVAVRDGYAYVGVWGSSELVTVDARNARAPVITGRCPLDGFGDGVAVRGQTVYIATGHHSRARKTWSPRPGEPGYGQGHGLELYDIADPARPRFISRIKTPPFYRIGNDMWGVKLAGRYAFVADTHNGAFVIDVGDPAAPAFVGHVRLPPAGHGGPRRREPALQAKRDPMRREALPDFVGGLAPASGHLYVAGGGTDLYVVAAPGLAEPAQRERGAPPEIGPVQTDKNSRFRVYRPDGQVRAVDMLGDLAVVAAGSDGIHLVQLDPVIRCLHRCPTQGFAMEVRVRGDRVYVAEERGGLSVWRKTGGAGLGLEGRYEPRSRIVRDVVVPEPGRYALLQVDLSLLDIVDLSVPAEPRRVLRDRGHGFVYHIADDVDADGSLCVLWQLGGLRWYDVSGDSPAVAVREPYAHRIGGGGSVLRDGQRLVPWRGGLVSIERGEVRPPNELPVQRVGTLRLSGRPQRWGDRLYVTDRTKGELTILDVSDADAPKLVEHLRLPGNPGRLVLHRGRLVIPNGYEGLWVEGR